MKKKRDCSWHAKVLLNLFPYAIKQNSQSNNIGNMKFNFALVQTQFYPDYHVHLVLLLLSVCLFFFEQPMPINA